MAIIILTMDVFANTASQDQFYRLGAPEQINHKKN